MIYELKDCGEAADILLHRPSNALRILMGTLIALLSGAFGWAHVTEVNLVVRAQGRVRPVT